MISVYIVLYLKQFSVVADTVVKFIFEIVPHHMVARKFVRGVHCMEKNVGVFAANYVL